VVSVAVESLDERLTAFFASDPEAMQDPYPLLAELRETSPVHRFGQFVLVSGYDDVCEVLGDGRRFSNKTMEEGTARVVDARSTLTSAQCPMFEEFVSMERGMTFMADGEEHAQRRKTTVHLFTPSRIRALESLTQQYTDEILDAVDGQEVVDLQPATGFLPGWIIANLLGLPREDAARLVEWGDAINLNLHRSSHLEPAHRALTEIYGYVEELVKAQDDGDPPTELFAAMLAARERGQQERIGSMFVEMQVGGYETTRGLLGGGIVLLMRNRAQWDRLVADPALAPNAVEELLRMVTPALWTARVPQAVTEIRGVRVSPDDTVFVMLGAANRDPEKFALPDELDITRSNAKQHRAFGVGPHYCLGQALARLEGAIFFRSLATQFPELELADPYPRRVGNANNPTFDGLHVRPGRRSPGRRVA
jgi:cytochrome P450